MKKRPRDANQLAKRIVGIATGDVEDREPSVTRVSAGAKGGKARANQLTPTQRAEAARLAAQARWRKKI